MIKSLAIIAIAAGSIALGANNAMAQEATQTQGYESHPEHVEQNAIDLRDSGRIGD